MLSLKTATTAIVSVNP